jgi:hypothetical protein
MKLTEKQIAHLKILRHGGPRGAYANGLHMGILASLERKGLVNAYRGIGSMFSPRTAIKWNITKAGIEALSK